MFIELTAKGKVNENGVLYHIRGMILFITLIFGLLSVVPLAGQSEFVEKGNDGLELNTIHVFTEGKDINGIALGVSFRGHTDLGLQWASAGEGGILIPSLAHHFGGNAGQFGVAALAGYVIRGNNGQNFLSFGPVIYINPGSRQGVNMIPALSATFSSLNSQVVLSLGVNLQFGILKSFVVRPALSVVEGLPQFGIALGLLTVYPR